MVEPKIELSEAQSWLSNLTATLDSLLRVRHAEESAQSRRDAIVLDFVRNEFVRLRRELSAVPRIEMLLDAVRSLSRDDLVAIRCRCLFYACDDLITLLVHKRVKGDAIAREEAVLYVQDRLQRDDFRRINQFQANRGASFVTYIWQVISNLLLDFLRTYGKRPTKSGGDDRQLDIDVHHGSVQDVGANSHVHEPGANTIDFTVEMHKLQESLAEVLAESRVAAANENSIRARLRPHLRLSSKERLFLKALFQYDLTINEVREMPGFQMNLNEAYRFYYRIMEQLLMSFKDAGVLDNMRTLVSDAAPRVSVSVAGEPATVAATNIYYLEQADRRSTGCHVRWQDGAAFATIAESFSRLSKRLAAYFSAISATVAVSDRVLAATRTTWSTSEVGEFSIAGVSRTFRIAKRYLHALKRRFVEKTPS